MMNDYTLPPVPYVLGLLAEGQRERIEAYGHACAEHVRGPLLARIAELESLKCDFERLIDKHAETLKERDRLRAEVEALGALLDGAAKTRAPKPRTLPTVGTGALHGEQQYCFEKGYREGASAVRKAIAVKVAARKGEGSEPPENCRQRLAAEGKPYPKSTCASCGTLSPKHAECDALLAAKRAAQAKGGAE